MRVRFIFLFLIIQSQVALAWPPTYGAEFEFTNQILSNVKGQSGETERPDGKENLAKKSLAERIREKCKTLKCKMTEVDGKWSNDFKVEFADGFFFKISHDPACVEVQTKPATLEEWTTVISKRMDEVLFSAVDEEGLFVNFINGAGHFNVGALSAFGDDGMAFLRYFVDYANQPELALGVLGDDLLNAPPLQVLAEDQKEALRKIILDFERMDPKKVRVKDVTERIMSEVYTYSFDESVKQSGDHYQAFGLKYVHKTKISEGGEILADAPFEFRSVFPQANSEAFTLMAELQEARIEYLKKVSAPIRFIKRSNAQKYKPQQLVDRYYKFVNEMGLPWNKFKKLMPSSLASTSPSRVLKGNFTWSEWSIKHLERWYDDLESSPWLRKRILEVIDSQKGTKNFDKIVDSLRAWAEGVPYSSVHKYGETFTWLKKVDKSLAKLNHCDGALKAAE